MRTWISSSESRSWPIAPGDQRRELPRESQTILLYNSGPKISVDYRFQVSLLLNIFTSFQTWARKLIFQFVLRFDDIRIENLITFTFALWHILEDILRRHHAGTFCGNNLRGQFCGNILRGHKLETCYSKSFSGVTCRLLPERSVAGINFSSQQHAAWTSSGLNSCVSTNKMASIFMCTALAKCPGYNTTF